MTRPSRILWLPALTVLLPCAFIGVLSYRWLAIEREAAAHRGAAAAQRLVTDLREDLSHALREAADAAARTLIGLPSSHPAFQRLPSASPLITHAFLFDASGRLVAPRNANAQTDASGNPALRRTLEDHRGESVLAIARAALVAGRQHAAERRAREIAQCCAAERDEYGVSLVLYAAWLRIAAYEADPQFTEKVTALAGELHDLVAEGHLGAPADVTQVKLLAERAKTVPAMRDLVIRVERTAADMARRTEVADLAARWISQWNPSPSDIGQPVIDVLGRANPPASAAFLRMADGRTIVLLVDRDGLDHWIARWAGAHDSFDIALRAGTSGARSPDVVETPVFADVPAAAILILRPQGSDPATERSRQRLFLTAVIVVVALTMITGYLAARDMSRELGTAAMRSTFVAGVTHELKTPLASIRLLAETLRHGRARPEVRDELLDTIVEEADRLARLVDNVLSSSRMESGTRAFSPQIVSLPDSVREAIRRFDYVLRKEGFALEEAIGNDAVLVHVDRDALEQALLNLLGNAVKYSGAARAIHIAVEHGDGRAVVRVADEGVGIDAEDHERIFESFYRAPRTAAETTGAGLGLALVRHFAEVHGGRVSVESHPGRGSVFSIVLPLAAETAHDSRADPAQVEESVPDAGHG